MRVTFLCIVCAILVDQANSANILGWMANQQQLPKDQRYKSVNRMALLSELIEQNHLKHLPDGRPNSQPSSQSKDQQDNQPNKPEQQNLLGTHLEPTAPQRAAKQTERKSLLDQSEIEKLLLIAKIERQEIQNSSKLLSEVGLQPQNKKRCKSNDDCLSAFKETHCDLHYGFCRESAALGEMCRLDRQCVSGTICSFGKCARPVTRGLVGSRCEEDSDCEHNHCCAKTLGHMVCKPKLVLGERCYVPNGGLDYSLNELCPCSEGLLCEAVEGESNSLRKIVPSSPRVEHLRCSLV